MSWFNSSLRTLLPKLAAKMNNRWPNFQARFIIDFCRYNHQCQGEYPENALYRPFSTLCLCSVEWISCFPLSTLKRCGGGDSQFLSAIRFPTAFIQLQNVVRYIRSSQRRAILLSRKPRTLKRPLSDRYGFILNEIEEGLPRYNMPICRKVTKDFALAIRTRNFVGAFACAPLPLKLF